MPNIKLKQVDEISRKITLSENSVKHIAAKSGIKVNTLYKWKTTDAHLSPAKADALTLYFLENEPKAIVAAAVMNYVLSILLDCVFCCNLVKVSPVLAKAR